MYTTRRIKLPEMRRLQMAHPDWASSGWTVSRLDGDDEIVVAWYADRHAAEEEVARLNEENDAG